VRLASAALRGREMRDVARGQLTVYLGEMGAEAPHFASPDGGDDDRDHDELVHDDLLRSANENRPRG
jgi:hypothetical protein